MTFTEEVDMVDMAVTVEDMVVMAEDTEITEGMAATVASIKQMSESFVILILVLPFGICVYWFHW